ncbi:MAG: winged helix-turn-helix transcriptional regulator [Microbacteriaceae bacterium]|nr:winged helix-turn-helix transcriptional regulator [Burkholderiaceae bacterium]
MNAAPEQTTLGDAVFESVAELFSLLSTPVRLKIISALCHGEKNVSELLGEIDTTQPNMSQHLSTLCRAVCTQVAIEMDPAAAIDPAERLRPGPAR